jgi:hypothetical protein
MMRLVDIRKAVGIVAHGSFRLHGQEEPARLMYKHESYSELALHHVGELIQVLQGYELDAQSNQRSAQEQRKDKRGIGKTIHARDNCHTYDEGSPNHGKLTKFCLHNAFTFKWFNLMEQRYGIFSTFPSESHTFFLRIHSVRFKPRFIARWSLVPFQQESRLNQTEMHFSLKYCNPLALCLHGWWWKSDARPRSFFTPQIYFFFPN